MSNGRRNADSLSAGSDVPYPSGSHMIDVPKFSNCDWQPKLAFQPWLAERLWTGLQTTKVINRIAFDSSSPCESNWIVKSLKTPICSNSYVQPNLEL
ncbi:hypothetical protein RSOLAG1IB_10048 [Rhizoctonia solani AG-1 IB]|uniref:Uncharacterized protein n=1 Tax=Thanatephorus cucumeris (strain AG1-IB / isolate 7/3/14) TaxID=1108050 RepID=A0A0B7FU30_THACB|nr:hypothetical protein RSOLAG1IB_10048 [Rhizoctonia solani AG-1 IB]